MKFRNAYSVIDRVGLFCPEPSLAQQQFKDEVDINVLLERFKVTGRMPEALRLPSYGDFTGVADYQSALNALNSARDSFMTLPAKVRSRFENDPQRFLEFVSDPANEAGMRELGLLPFVPAAGTPAAGPEPKA